MLKCLPFLPIYRAATAGVAPLTPLFLYWRSQQGKEDRARLAERFGKPSLPRPHGKLAWLHGASVGESVALLPLVEKLTVRGFQILLSTSTTSSAAIMAARLPAGSIHQYLPLDVGKYMAGFLDYWRPDLALIAESEIWPNLFFEARRRKIPMILVNARMSPRSFRRWRALAASCGDLLGCLDLCLAQSEEDAERFAALGAAHVLVAGNLKYDVAPPPADPKVLAQLAGRIGTRPTWVAASTHPGEDEIVLSVHRALSARLPSLLTIVVPRHARRGPEIAALAETQGLAFLQRTQDATAAPLPQVYIADTMGELGLFFRLAHIAFLGKSLVGSGGQNPIEAAKLGCAILHGPLVGNFAEVYKILDDARGACCIDNADTLARALTILLADAAKLRSVSRIASETVKKLGGASSTIMKTLEPHIAQLLINQCA
ncbi:MAG: 3-deoxy-D-manno-octulosonic acid transferase [Beijerinckiaceae bacterium]